MGIVISKAKVRPDAYRMDFSAEWQHNRKLRRQKVQPGGLLGLQERHQAVFDNLKSGHEQHLHE